jgi:hypothetical protein
MKTCAFKTNFLIVIIAIAFLGTAMLLPSALFGANIQYNLSSGLFGLPANAASVDWMIVNNSARSQTVTVTVFQAGVGPKSIVPPGPLTITIPAAETYHNANNVGTNQPFVPGFYYEVEVLTTSWDVLPSVHIWQDFGNTVIPGTLIPPGSWVRRLN